MKTPFRLFLVATLLIFASCSESKHNFNVEKGIWISNVTIISPESENIEPIIGTVVIDQDQILYAGQEDVVVTGNYQRIDATGKYLIPGLIDSHVHLSSIAGMNYKQVRELPELSKSYFEQLPNSYLYFGYTTLIDPNNYNPRIMKQIIGREITPDIYTCGEQVKVMDDFMMAEDTPDDRYKFYPNFLHDKYNKNVIIRDSIDLNEHTVNTIVLDIVNKQDGICLKTIYEDGFGGTEEMTWELPSIDIMKDLVLEAKNESIPVLLHANSYAAQKFGSDADVDIIAHGMWHWGLLEDYLDVSELPETHKELLATIAKQNIGYQPTFRVIAGQRDVFDPAFIEDSDLENVLPANLLTWLKSEEGLWQKNRILTYGGDHFNYETPDAQIASLMQSVVDKITVTTNYLYLEKGNLLFGSDTPAMNNHANPPGYNGYLEMKEWIKAGVSLQDLLKAVTINNAKEFNLDGSLGTIEVGKKANLVLLEQNPLQDVAAYKAIYKVILHGNLHDRQLFSAKNQ